MKSGVLIILMVFSLATSEVRATDTLTLDVEKEDLGFPYVKVANEIVVASPVFYPLDNEYSSTNELESRFIYKINLTQLLPRDRYLYDKQECFESQLNLALEYEGNHLKLNYLVEADQKNLKPKVYEIKMNQPAFVELCFQSKCEREPFCFNAQIEIENTTSRGLKITNLLYFNLSIEIDSTDLDFRFMCNFWEINFMHKGFDLSVDSINANNYTLNEAFEFQGNWYKFVNLDILKSTIQLVRIEETERIQGIKKGYYVDFLKLTDLCRKATQDGNDLIQQFGQKNILLYFWGPWCAPCIKNIEAHLELSARLVSRDSVVVLNFPFLLLEHDANDLAILRQTHNISSVQFVQDYNNGYYPEETKYDIPNNVLDLLKVTTFPEYILLNREGRILFRGNNSKKDLQYLLRTKQYL